MIKITPAPFYHNLLDTVRPKHEASLLAPLSPSGDPEEMMLIGNFSYCRDGFGQRMVAEKDMTWNRAQHVRSYIHYTVPPPGAEEDISVQWPIVHDGRFYFMLMPPERTRKNDLVNDMVAGMGRLNAYLRQLDIPEVRVTCDVKWSTPIRRGPFVVVDAPEIFITNTWTLSCLTWFVRQAADRRADRTYFFGYMVSNLLSDWGLAAPELEDRLDAHLVLEMMSVVGPREYEPFGDRYWAMDYGYSCFLSDCFSCIAHRRYFKETYPPERVEQVVPYAKYLEEIYIK